MSYDGCYIHKSGLVTSNYNRSNKKTVYKKTLTKRALREQSMSAPFVPTDISKKTRGPLVIHQKRWYFRLVTDVNQMGPDGLVYRKARALMDDYKLDVIAKHLVICYTPNRLPHAKELFRTKDGNIIRIYAFFESYMEFYNYMRKFSLEERSFYEIIFGELPQKPHFDIDIKISELEDEDAANVAAVGNFIVSDIIKTSAQVLRELGIVLSIEKDVLIYSSHGSNKQSYHLVFNNICHDSNYEAKAFYNTVISKMSIDHKYKYFIDHSVYSKRQQFRILGCKKLLTNEQEIRLKILHSTFDYDGNNYTHVNVENDTIDDLEYINLYESLISFTSGCTYIPSLVPEKSTNGIDLESLECLGQEKSEYCLQLFKDKFLEQYPGQTTPFTIINIIGHKIYLKRHHSSFCPICQRFHEHENPFIFILYGKIFWDCRRCTTGTKKYFVGYLYISYKDMLKMNPLDEHGNPIINTTNSSSSEDFSDIDEDSLVGEIGDTGMFCFGDQHIFVKDEDTYSLSTNSSANSSTSLSSVDGMNSTELIEPRFVAPAELNAFRKYKGMNIPLLGSDVRSKMPPPPLLDNQYMHRAVREQLTRRSSSISGRTAIQHAKTSAWVPGFTSN